MKPYVWQVRVYYEDTDAGGVVYYANYLKFMERARTEWLRSFSIEQNNLVQEYNILFVVRSLNIQYKKPAKFNDALQVTVDLVAIRPASISFRQVISTADEPENILATADVNIACLQADSFTPQAIPKEIFKEINSAR